MVGSQLEPVKTVLCKRKGGGELGETGLIKKGRLGCQVWSCFHHSPLFNIIRATFLLYMYSQQRLENWLALSCIKLFESLKACLFFVKISIQNFFSSAHGPLRFLSCKLTGSPPNGWSPGASG